MGSQLRLPATLFGLVVFTILLVTATSAPAQPPVLPLACAFDPGADPTDSDGDGIPDACDNCINVPNPDQRDTDADGYGNACDGDLNNSGMVNFPDLGLFRVAFGSADPHADFNGDGAVNFVDLAIFGTLFGEPPGPTGLTAWPANTPPVADAGRDQTALLSQTVTLDATASTDVDGQRLRHYWQIESAPAGSTSTLSHPNAVRPTLFIDAEGTWEIRLWVDDGAAVSEPATVRISTVNSAPVADAGPDKVVTPGTQVTLDGSGSSDVDGDPLGYAWSLTDTPAGSAAALETPDELRTSFMVDLAGTYIAQLTVSDGLISSAPDTVTVTTGNALPVADAGADQSIVAGDPAGLDGSGSGDANGDPLAFEWSLLVAPISSAAALDDPAAVTPGFTSDLPGTYVGQLIVDDGSETSAPDTVVLSTENSRPIAKAGPDQAATVGEPVTLNGGASSDADNDPLSFRWALLHQPAGGAAALSGADTSTPVFTPDVPGLYIAQLIVSDGVLDSRPDTVVIEAAPTDTTPPDPEPAILSGQAVKGPIVGGTVTAYPIGEGTPGSVLGTALTDATGRYTLTIADYSGPVLLEVTGGAFVDEASGEMIGLPVAPGSGLQAVVGHVAAGSEIEVQITPLTTMAAAYAAQMTGGLTASNIDAANQQIGVYFGGIDLLATRPVDPTVAGSAAGASQEAIDYGLVLGGLSQLAQTIGADPLQLIVALSGDLGDGRFDGESGGEPVLVNGNPLPAVAGSAGLAYEIDAFSANDAQNLSGGTVSSALIILIAESEGKIPGTFTISGTITGLDGTVILQNNGGDNLSRSENGGFTFATPIANGDSYNVTVFTQPTTQVCAVANGAGTANPNVVNVAVTCAEFMMTPVSIKVFRFTWPDIPGRTEYRLLEDPDGSSEYTQIASIAPGVQSYDHEVFLPGRVNARYILRSCSGESCTDSAPLHVTGTLAEAVGYAKASNTDTADGFGRSIALSRDGKTLAVGAWFESSNATGIDGDQSDNSAFQSGAVYVFTRTDVGVWSQQAYVKGSNTDAGDRFGWHVALSGDGNTLAVGAPYRQYSIPDPETGGRIYLGHGATYVFTRTDGTWSEQAYLGSGQAPDWDLNEYPLFGDIALSGDGNTLVVLHGNFNNTRVFVFTRTGGVWGFQTTFAQGALGDWGVYRQESAALSDDGNTLAVGVRYDYDTFPSPGLVGWSQRAAGAARVFTRTNGVWSQQAYLDGWRLDGDGNTGGCGAQVALSGNGDTLAVGACGDASSATGIDGDETDDSAPYSGAVHVFSRAGGVWSRQAYVKASNTDAGDGFGAVALSGDGKTLAVGSLYESSRATGINGDQTDNWGFWSGAVYVFTRTDAGVWSQQAYLKPPYIQPLDFHHFGWPVALSGDGKTLAVGSADASSATGINGDQTDNSAWHSGAVYLY